MHMTPLTIRRPVQATGRSRMFATQKRRMWDDHEAINSASYTAALFPAKVWTHLPGPVTNPSPPFRGEREGPVAKRWEGEVGDGERSEIPHLTPALSAPRRGEEVLCPLPLPI